jgi:membrane-bound metal-dependent hydrolase YbcI (DUF457 family)
MQAIPGISVMLNEPTVWGIYIGIVLSLLFLFVHFVIRKPPKFNEVALILLSSVGSTLGFDFGYLVITSDARVFGPLKEHRITMLLGALAVIWTSCESLIQICYPLWSARTQKRSDAHILDIKKAEAPNSSVPADDNRAMRGSTAER